MAEPVLVHIATSEVERRRELGEACARLANPRPLGMVYADSPFYCRLAGIDLQQTYRDPHAMIRSQIMGWKAILEAIDCDVPGISVSLAFGSFLTASTYGCEVAEQPGSVPGFLTWFAHESDLTRLEAMDPCSNGYEAINVQFYHQLQELAEQYPVQYDGGEVQYPVRKARLATWTEGPFTIACMIAGLDQVSLWCYEQPQLVHRLLEIITAKEIQRIRHSFTVMGEAPQPTSMADDYSPYLSLEMYQEFVLPYQKQIRDAFGSTTGFHSCIPDAKLITSWRDELKIRVFNGFKPRQGLGNVLAHYRPVADALANRIVLEPDLDGANAMIASESQLGEAVQTVYELFSPGRGLKICATLCGGHRLDDLAKMNVIKRTICRLAGNER